MNLHHKQSQFELFPSAASVTVSKTSSSRYLFSNMTFSLENLIVTGICAVMAVIFFFSLGVERGKRIVLNNSPLLSKKVSFLDNAVASSANRSLKAEALVKPNSPSVAVNSKNNTQFLKPQNIGAEASSVTDVQAQEKIKAANPAVMPENLKNTLQVPPALASNAYTIQVASFKTIEYANQEASLLKKKGYDIFVINKGSYVIVCVGKFFRQTEAKATLGELKKKYRDCLVRRF